MSASPAARTENNQGVAAGRGAIFIGAAKLFFMFAGFLQRWLLARVVGAAEYGAFSLVNSVVSTANNTLVQGTIQAISRFTAEREDHARAVRAAGLRMQLVVGGVVAVAFFFSAPLIASWVGAPSDYVRWFRIAAVLPFVYGLYAVFIGSFNGQRWFAGQAGFDMAFSACKTVLLLGGAVVGSRMAGPRAAVTGAFVGFASTAALILAAAALVTRRRDARAAALAGPEVPHFPARRLFQFFLGVGVYAALVNIALNFDLLWLRRLAGQAVTSTRADALVGNYEALRTLALLPYQFLMVATFVVFPLVSRATFDNDRAATSAYLRQTLRLCAIGVAAMGVALSARPQSLLAILYRPEYLEGAAALPILVAGQCALAMFGVSCAILNAAGRPGVAVALVSLVVVTGSGAALGLVAGAEPGGAMLRAQATAMAAGAGTGLAAALAFLAGRLSDGARAALPVASFLRVAASAAIAIGLARLAPRMPAVFELAMIGGAALVYLAALALLREFDAVLVAQLRRVVSRRTGA